MATWLYERRTAVQDKQTHILKQGIRVTLHWRYSVEPAWSSAQFCFKTLCFKESDEGKWLTRLRFADRRDTGSTVFSPSVRPSVVRIMLTYFFATQNSVQCRSSHIILFSLFISFHRVCPPLMYIIWMSQPLCVGNTAVPCAIRFYS